jgi:hypothetical protein
LSSLRDVERRTTETITSAKQTVADAEKIYRAGQVIGAARKLATVAEAVKGGDGVVSQIGSVAGELAAQDRRNVSDLEAGRREANEASSAAQDGRTRRAAAQAVDTAISEYNRAARAVDAQGRDPRAVADAIKTARSSIATALELALDDHQAYDAATAAITAATAEVTRARSYSDGGYSASSYGDGGHASLTQAGILLASGNYEAAAAAAAAASTTAELNMASATSAADSDRQAAADAAAAARQQAADNAAEAASNVSADSSPASDTTSGEV